VAVGLVVLIMGFGVGRATAPTTVEEKFVPSPASGDARAAASRVAAGVPVGYPRTERGAIAAALNYSASTGPRFWFNPQHRLMVVRTIGTPGFVRRWLDPGIERGYGVLARSPVGRALRSGRPAIARGTPLGYRVVTSSPSRVVLETWTVYVLGSQDAGPVARFSRSRSVLVWQHGDWKVADGHEIGIGPTPTIVHGDRPASSDAFMAAVDGMRSYRYVP
jgi:hypothetical protein